MEIFYMEMFPWRPCKVHMEMFPWRPCMYHTRASWKHLYKRSEETLDISSDRMTKSYEKVDMEMVYIEMFPWRPCMNHTRASWKHLYKRSGRNVEYISISSDRITQSYEKVDMEMIYMEMFPWRPCMNHTRASWKHLNNRSRRNVEYTCISIFFR